MTPQMQTTRSIATTDNHSASAPAPEPPDLTPSFADQLKELRRRTACKQAILSEIVGCSEAAVSFWENGARLPKKRMLALLLTALAEHGASALELHALTQRWQHERIQRPLHIFPVTRPRPDPC
jgi:DNA-binding transcriptional regulator YiaG